MGYEFNSPEEFKKWIQKQSREMRIFLHEQFMKQVQARHDQLNVLHDNLSVLDSKEKDLVRAITQQKQLIQEEITVLKQILSIIKTTLD